MSDFRWLIADQLSMVNRRINLEICHRQLISNLKSEI